MVRSEPKIKWDHTASTSFQLKKEFSKLVHPDKSSEKAYKGEMNELLQKHGCANVFTVPEGLKELMGDITREVLRDQPPQIFDYIANYLSVLLITREHGILAVRILEDLCDCKPSVSETLIELGFDPAQAEELSQIIKEEVEGFEPLEGKEKIKEMQIMKRILGRSVLDEPTSAKVCQVARNAYRDYWYRKNLLRKNFEMHPNEPWEIAAEHTLALYKRTKPSLTELTRATQKIQAAYKGYHVRRNLLSHLDKKKKSTKNFSMQGPPIDVAGSREIDLGPIVNIKPKEDNIGPMFDKNKSNKLGVAYNPMRTVTHLKESDFKPTGTRSQQSPERDRNLEVKAIKSAPARYARC